jgi:hypothetical protein
MNADFQGYAKYLKQFLLLDLCVLGDLGGERLENIFIRVYLRQSASHSLWKKNLKKMP